MTCNGCGGNHARSDCNHRNAVCWSCGKEGHVERVCRSAQIYDSDSDDYSIDDSDPPDPCKGCGGDHWRSKCPHRNATCWNCGKKGHVNRVCKFPRARTTQRAPTPAPVHLEVLHQINVITTPVENQSPPQTQQPKNDVDDVPKRQSEVSIYKGRPEMSIKWKNGVCGCVKSAGKCCSCVRKTSCCCCCCYSARMIANLDFIGFWSRLGYILTCACPVANLAGLACLRKEVRENRHIKGNAYEDCCLSFACPQCTLFQMLEEMDQEAYSF